jgi:hypothetical protein
MGRDDKSIISVRPMHDLQDPATTVWDCPERLRQRRVLVRGNLAWCAQSRLDPHKLKATLPDARLNVDTEFQHLPPGALFPPCPIHTRLNPGGGRHAAH